MVIYGIRSVKIASENLFNIECPSCKKRSSTELYVFSKHVHLFWVPMLPIGKTGVAQCEHCKKVTAKKEMTAAQLEEYNRLKRTAKPKAWQFAGSALLALMIYLVASAIAEDNRHTKEFLAAPKAGDRYHIKSDNGYYTSWKIAALKGDSLTFDMNMKEVNKITGLSDIDKPENYNGLNFTFSRQQVQAMYDKGEIDKIIRN